MKTCELGDLERRAILWNYAFMGRREIFMGAVLLVSAIIGALIWLGQAYWRPWTGSPWFGYVEWGGKILITVFGAAAVGSLLLRGKPLLGGRAYYEKRTGYAEPKLLPRARWSNRRATLYTVAGAIGLGVVALFLHSFAWTDGRPLISGWMAGPGFAAVLFGVCFLAEGLVERHKPYIIAGVVMLLGLSLSCFGPANLAIRCVTIVVSLGVGFLLAGIMDHQIYLELWRRGYRVGKETDHAQE